MLDAPYLRAIFNGVLIGNLIRYFMLRRDYRQYPSYPHGVVTHLSLGFIAAVIGSVAVPVLIEKEFMAVTFLTLAATQFREVRDMEREMLQHLDQARLVSRGPDYIEGIARVFEARNYLVMFTSLLVGGITYRSNIFYGMVAGIIAFLVSRKLMGGRVIAQIAQVREGKVHFKGANLFVEDIHFMNLGTDSVKETYLERGLGVIIEPFDDDARATLSSNGQRMAIAHDAAALLGIYKDVDTAEFTPIVRRDLDTGRVGLVIVPIERDIEFLLEAVKRVPVLESAYRAPLKTYIGRKASD
ncbi:MAG: hypothetical protein C4554_10420 [Dethiobacter sp.]|jgi:hypothetical protein|nr:MAG: hypothetical protein C4554_10420 [Dethiobacter sp.]